MHIGLTDLVELLKDATINTQVRGEFDEHLESPYDVTLRHSYSKYLLLTLKSGNSKVLIFLSDGESQDDESIPTEAKLNLDAEIITIAVGIAPQFENIKHLTDIANGQSDQVFKARDFNSISKIQTALVNEVCKNVQREDCKGNTELDVAIILDGSTTIHPLNFEKCKDFAKKLVEKFSIDEGQTQVSVITYATKVREEFALNTYKTKEQVLTAIDNVAYLSGDTKTNLVLEYLKVSINLEIC